jgi:hypothetical protein
MLALHVCRRVTAYGLMQLPNLLGFVEQPRGAYNEPCKNRPPNEAVNAQEQAVVRVLAAAGLVGVGEPCGAECMEGVEGCRRCLKERRIDVGAAMPHCTNEL